MLFLISFSKDLTEGSTSQLGKCRPNRELLVCVLGSQSNRLSPLQKTHFKVVEKGKGQYHRGRFMRHAQLLLRNPSVYTVRNAG